MTEGEIVPVEPPMLLKPLASPEEARETWLEYEGVRDAVTTDSDYTVIQGKKTPNKSYFRKIAVFFGLSDSIVEHERTDREDESFMHRLVVEATAPNGRASVGVGICDSRERKFAHPEHDVYATAHTRAKNRAISDMVAGGAVSAEEMQGNPRATTSLSNERKVAENGKKRKLSEIANVAPYPEIGSKLAESGLDPGLVNVYDYGKKTHIVPLEELGPEWNSFDEVLAPLGARWIDDPGRWEIPIGGET